MFLVSLKARKHGQSAYPEILVTLCGGIWHRRVELVGVCYSQQAPRNYPAVRTYRCNDSAVVRARSHQYQPILPGSRPGWSRAESRMVHDVVGWGFPGRTAQLVAFR